MDNTRLYYLIDLWLAEELTRKELVELNDMLNGADADMVGEQVQLYMDAKLQAEQFNFQPDLTAFHERLAQKIAEQEEASAEPIKVRRMPWLRYAAAAAILFAIATTYFLLQPNKTDQTPTAQTQTERFKNDILPGKPGTILRLANGKEILLDTVQNGSAINGFTKNANSLSVNDANVPSATVIVPKGKAIQTITLADGSLVTLNAESSLTFPTAFTKATREVSMTGEIYFEVAHNATKPFFVSTPTDKIEVLGTHFNINAYNSVKTTLLEGKVKIGTAILKPGEQFAKGKITPQDSETLEQIMAWKNGMFRFNETTIHEIMDDVERAYDVKVVYQGETSKLHFSGAVPRTANVSELLKKMELTKTVEFSIDGNTITVRPK
jgi:transmembrane sensor